MLSFTSAEAEVKTLNPDLIKKTDKIHTILYFRVDIYSS